MRHFFNFYVVKHFYLLDYLRLRNSWLEADCCCSDVYTAGATNSVNVVLLPEGEIVVNNEAYRLNIDPSYQQVSCHKDSNLTSPKILQDQISVGLKHFSMDY